MRKLGSSQESAFSETAREASVVFWVLLSPSPIISDLEGSYFVSDE